MIIRVSTGIGTGPTKLAAFDSALHKMGIENFNLIVLSSVIPPGSEILVIKDKPKKVAGKWGDRLYLVMAEARVDTPNQEAWAGIGWVQNKKTGKGLFVEHEGSSKDSVRQDITASLSALVKTRRSTEFGKINMVVNGAICKYKPICVAVTATYMTTPWIESNGIYK